jgi:hypothetical protein
MEHFATAIQWNTLSFLLQHNQLTKLEQGAFGRLPVVFELNLAHNLLNNVTVRAFEGLLQLLLLNLTANNLTTIPNGAFQGEACARHAFEEPDPCNQQRLYENLRSSLQQL